MRESSVRGPAIDLSEFERRMRAAETPQVAPPKTNPLSELARLMQGETAQADALNKILPDPRAARAAPPPPPQQPQWDAPLRGSLDAAPPVQPEPRHYEEAHPHYAQHQGHEHQGHETQGHEHQGYEQHQSYDAHAYAHGQQADQHYDAAYHGGAEGGWPDDAEYLDYGAEESPETARGGVGKYLRPWHAVAAISVIAVASIGWGFLHRGGVGGSKEIAVINAPEGPVKVKPSAETEQETASDNGAAVLDRKDSTPVKQVVTHQEQAIDPTVAPKAVTLGNGPVDAPHEPALGSQPHKVKTVTVRPDGSRVDEASVPPAVAKSANPVVVPLDPFQAKGATPKPETKTATTPAPKPKPAPKPAPKVAAVEPPADAGETAAAAPATTSGGYAVQFGAANTEEEARTLLKTVSAKYGVRPTFKPAKVGDKTVYRVRVAGVSKESANAICNKVKASGGNCFVAGN
ncbi:SPOR domain-containing protein [Methylocystis sp. JR02]|uniref:SPOR domain-containing protein n=1 Tax=Methylocystis sp. JR02 TaxID=3046284 RepID=UPI0024B87993|nr:SPOR domain-containing protein [Methylocystis sp. JR02]MDJ0448356.1 SPOR domain-containing protein [Methylocystis sp. JR02]